MKKIIRKWLGINEDKEEIYDLLKDFAKAIDKIFNLKKKDMSVLGMVKLMRIEKMGEDLQWKIKNY